MYSKDAPFPVYCQSCFFGESWDSSEYGQEYQENRPFFEQYRELLQRVPHLGIINKQSENSEYCNYAYAQKNCYLTFGSHQEESCRYEAYSTKNKDSQDFLWMYGSELVYECIFSQNCYRCLYLDHCEDCTECLFSTDLKGCNHCLFCANLRHKEYYIFNEKHTRQEYEQKLAELKLHTFRGLEKAKHAYLQELPQKFPVRALYQVNCENCEGGTISHCKNMRDCSLCADSEDCTYGCQVDATFSSMDIDYMGYDRTERSYQLIGCQGLFRCMMCNASWHGNDLTYCQFCFSCKNLLGCASLHQKSHCILNKQYEQSEYEAIVSRITEAMQKEKVWGQFFATSLSPFAYNETIAMDWFPLTQEEAQKKGFLWKEHDEVPEVEKAIQAADLPDSTDDIPDDVLNWALHCTKTQRPFRIIPQELAFYREMRLPLPRLHPDERHRARIGRRHGRELFNRECTKCRRSIQTTYAPERPEAVYCEECYLKEVY
jgi:hypothetical protein